MWQIQRGIYSRNQALAPAPSGGGGGGTSLAGSTQVITWDAATANGGTLANGNRDLVDSNGAAWASPIATVGASSGLKYAEFTIVNPTVAQPGILFGIGDTNFSHSNYLGGSSSSAGIWVSGSQSLANGVTVNNAVGPGPVVNGDVFGLAYDATSGKAWLHRNGVYYNSGNPALGTNPWVTWTPGGTWYPAGTNSTTSPAATIRLAATTAYDAPSGFTVL